MTETLIRSILYPILRSGMGLETPPVPLSEADCRALFELGKQQAILPVIWQGVQKQGVPRDWLAEQKQAQSLCLYQYVLLDDALRKIGATLDKAGIGYAKTKVGDKYVYENMVRYGNRIGGEQSGHIIFSKYATTGDGILTSLKIMEVMLAKEKPLSVLAAPVVFYPQVLKNVRVKSKPDAQNDPDVMEAVRLVGEKLGQDGRILVRESGTEPVIRVMVEADTDEICEKYVDSVIDVIEEKGHITE